VLNLQKTRLLSMETSGFFSGHMSYQIADSLIYLYYGILNPWISVLIYIGCDKKCNRIQRFFNKGVNRCLSNIILRPAEKEGWSTIQVCTAGKGLLGPWGWMAVIMRKQVHGQSKRLTATLPHSLRQGQTTR